jgi:hypothetical protein
MRTPNIRGLGVVQDSFTMRWKATGEVEDISWLEAWGSTMVEALEALQTRVATLMAEKRPQEEES